MTPQAKRALFDQLREAQRALYLADRPTEAQARICLCCRGFRGLVGHVYRAADGSDAWVSGIMKCKQACCPVCAAAMAEFRREELTAANLALVKAAGTPYLMTLTVPHERGEACDELLTKVQKAFEKLRSSRAWKEIVGGQGASLGTVKAIETTWSLLNGYHPHFHLLLFCTRRAFGEGAPVNDDGDLASAAIDRLKAEWLRACLKTGLGSSDKRSDMLARGLNVRGGEKAAAYIAKYGREEQWGLSSEMTRHLRKAAGRKLADAEAHYTPWQLLNLAAEGYVLVDREDREYDPRAIYAEWARAMHSRSHLVWSPGLRGRLGMGDVSDEEAVDRAEEKPALNFGAITPEDLSLLLSRNAYGDFLRYVMESCGNPESAEQDVRDYLDMLKDRPRVAKGWVWLKRLFDPNRRRECADPSAVRWRDAA